MRAPIIISTDLLRPWRPNLATAEPRDHDTIRPQPRQGKVFLTGADVKHKGTIFGSKGKLAHFIYE